MQLKVLEKYCYYCSLLSIRVCRMDIYSFFLPNMHVPIFWKQHPNFLLGFSSIYHTVLDSLSIRLLQERHEWPKKCQSDIPSWNLTIKDSDKMTEHN